jgi:Protein kinase domain
MADDPRIGTDLAGYRIEGFVGRGGMSVVYLARHMRLGRTVALKILSPELAADEAFRRRFLRESRMAATIQHPNVIPVYEADEADGELFITMPFVEGSDLAQLLRERGALEPSQALSIVGQVAGALDTAHDAGLVHRDVKPANILLTVSPDHDRPYHAYLSDFGLTKQTLSQSHLTRTGEFVGTIAYIAPEQVRGEEVDGRTDQYSLACVLFECLTGRLPFDRETEAAVLYGHLLEAPPRPSQVRPELPPALDDVLATGMSKVKEDRFPSCSVMVQTARDPLGGTAPGKASTPTVVPGGARTTRKAGSPTRAVRAEAAPRTRGHAAPAEMPAPIRPARRSRGPLLAGIAVAAVIAVALALTVLPRGDAPTVGGADAPATGTGAQTGSQGARPRSGPVILEDALTQPSTDWDLPSGPAFSVGFSGGGLRFRVEEPERSALSLNHSGRLRAEPDVAVEVDAAKVEGPDANGFGIVCRASSDGLNYYAIRISSDGTWDIIESVDGNPRQLAAGTEPIRTGNADWRLHGECSGSEDVRLRLFVDGNLVGEAVDRNDIRPTGTVGLIAVAGGVPLELIFAGFLVRRI